MSEDDLAVWIMKQWVVCTSVLKDGGWGSCSALLRVPASGDWVRFVCKPCVVGSEFMTFDPHQWRMHDKACSPNALLNE